MCDALTHNRFAFDIETRKYYELVPSLEEGQECKGCALEGRCNNTQLDNLLCMQKENRNKIFKAVEPIKEGNKIHFLDKTFRLQIYLGEVQLICQTCDLLNYCESLPDKDCKTKQEHYKIIE